MMGSPLVMSAAVPWETREVPGVEGLRVGRDGSVWNYQSCRQLWVRMRPILRGGGFTVRISCGGRDRYFSVARAVLRAWVGPRPIGCNAFHFPDRDPTNCRLENLRWAPKGTSQVGSAPDRSTRPRGEGHVGSRLTEGDVRWARAAYRAGWTADEIAREIGVAANTIKVALRGRTWRHVPDPEGPVAMRPSHGAGEANASAVLTWDVVREIRGRYAGQPRMSQAALAREYGVCRRTIQLIVMGETWKEPQAASGVV